jgi:hypothetical protein
MNTATVLTPWKGSGTYADPYRPALADDHPVASWADLSGGNATTGGTYTIAIQCDDATLAAIEADPKYQGKITVTHGS